MNKSFEDLLSESFNDAAAKWWMKASAGTASYYSKDGSVFISRTPNAVMAGRNAVLFEELAADLRLLDKEGII